MREMVERFQEVIDRTYGSRPVERARCLQIFWRVFEDTMGVTVVPRTVPVCRGRGKLRP